MERSQALAFSVLALSLMLLTNFYVFYYRASRTVAIEAVILDVSRHGRSHQDDEQLVADMLLWPSLVQSAHKQERPVSMDRHNSEIQYLLDCWKDPDWFRMFADSQCVFLWLRVLEHGTVSSIDNILPVVSKKEHDQGVSGKPQQNGGIRCYFQGTPEEMELKGYWKPCRKEDIDSNSECFASEIVAFHIDHILGFYRTPAVVPRVFAHRQLVLFAHEAMNRVTEQDTEALEKIKSVERHCGRLNRQFADGAMVGWAPKDVQLLSKHIDKSQKDENFVKFNSMTDDEVDRLRGSRFDIHSDSKIEDINWALENVAVNLFAILTNNFGRFGHNLFIQVGEKGEFGPFIYIDNDRSKWKYDLRVKGKVPKKAKDHPLATFCKFPKQLARRLLLLESLKDDGISLGKLVYMSTQVYEDVPSGALFSEEQAEFLDMNASYVVDIIEICLQKHPTEDVLFDEPGQQEYDFFSNLIDNLAGKGNSANDSTFFLNNLMNLPHSNGIFPQLFT